MDPKRPSNEPFEPRTWETMKRLRTRYASPLTLQTTYWKRFVKMRSPGKGPWPCVWMDDESVDIFRHHKITKSFFSLMWQFCTRLIFLNVQFLLEVDHSFQQLLFWFIHFPFKQHFHLRKTDKNNHQVTRFSREVAWMTLAFGSMAGKKTLVSKNCKFQDLWKRTSRTDPCWEAC